MRSKFQELQTNRLRLRQLSADDLDDLIALRYNDTVIRYIDRKLPEDKTEVVNFIRDRIEDVSKNRSMFWVICNPIENRLIGTICLWNFNSEKTVAEVGYELHPDFHKKGYMSEALNAVIEFGFDTLKLNTIEAFTNKHNKSSMGLLTNFKFELEENRKDKDFPDNIIYTLHNA